MQKLTAIVHNSFTVFCSNRSWLILQSWLAFCAQMEVVGIIVQRWNEMLLNYVVLRVFVTCTFIFELEFITQAAKRSLYSD
jgi:hypothetical protein